MIRRLRQSAAWRLALAIAGAYALTTALLGAVVFWATHAVVVHQLDASVRVAATALTAEYRAAGESGLTRAISGREERSADPLGYALFDGQGRRVGGELAAPRPPLGWSEVAFVDPLEGPDVARGFALDLNPDRRLLVAADAEFVSRSDQAILALFGMALLVVLALGALGALLVGTFLKARLATIADTADAIVGEALDRRVPLSGTGDEFDRVASSLNLMLERIVTLVANLRQVSGDLAHDLRTPLTRMRADLEEALAEDAPPAYRRAIHRALEQAEDVLSIFDATLRIAEIEAGTARRRFTRLDLGGLAREVVDALLPAAEDAGHRLEVTAESAHMVDGDRQLLAQALVNLVDNALRHTPAGTRVVVSVALATEGGPCLTVADTGPGVPAADRQRILERFVRLETARHTPGHGLGLSIVKAVCDLHGVDLSLDDNHPGLVFQLTFPTT